MENYYINGSSSLLFIISTLKAFYSSNLISWKMSNVFLVGASFLCNASEYNPTFLFMDYLAIYLVCLSYINNIYVSVPYTLLLIYEYKNYKTIENTKNLTFITAIGKTNIHTYLYVDNLRYTIISISSLSSLIIYKIRYFLYKNNNKKYNLLLTYLLHINIMNIIYISSITAID